MVLPTRTYEDMALVDVERLWECHDGRMVEKVPLSAKHGDLMTELGFAIRAQRDPNQFRMRINHARLRRSSGGVYIPDIVVVPIADAQRISDHQLDLFDTPAWLIVEIVSPSTERIDFRDKLPAYRERGDHEIWLVHPTKLWAQTWVRRDDGQYLQAEYGVNDRIRTTHVPSVEIRLSDLRMP